MGAQNSNPASAVYTLSDHEQGMLLSLPFTEEETEAGAVTCFAQGLVCLVLVCSGWHPIAGILLVGERTVSHLGESEWENLAAHYARLVTCDKTKPNKASPQMV